MALFEPHIALATSENTILLFDFHKKQMDHVFKGHTDYVRSVDFSYDGEYIASASDDTTVKIWNKKGRYLEKNLTDNLDRVRVVKFSKEFLATGSKDCNIYVYDSKSFEKVCVFQGHVTGIWSLTFTEGFLASASDKPRIMLWNLNTKTV